MKTKRGFGALPPEFSGREKSRIAVIPVPYDGTSTWIKGADKGPEAIIEASSNMELYDIETGSNVCEKGIFTDEPVLEKTPEKMTEAVRKRAECHIRDKKFVVVLGGEHSVSIGSVRAHANNYKNVSVLQLDANSDLRDEYLGSKYNHACVMARIKEICPAVQVGIRSMDSSELEHMEKGRVFFAETIREQKNWIGQVVARLPGNVYATIDLDVFDPSVIPSVGTPEPGGLSWYDVLELLRAVIRKRSLIGFDVVELCPNQNKYADFAAAKLIYKLLSYKFMG